MKFDWIPNVQVDSVTLYSYECFMLTTLYCTNTDVQVVIIAL